MIEGIIALLSYKTNTSTLRIDIAKGKYKLPENNKELLNTLKTINKEWKSSRSK